jgi:hypothetical protein
VSTLTLNLSRVVEQHLHPRRHGRRIGSARRRTAAPVLVALGDAAATLGLYLPLRCREQQDIDAVLAVIERIVARTPAGRRWAVRP